MVSALQPSFDDLSVPLHQVTFCTLDLETTGGSAATCEITEIGAVKHRQGEVLGTFQTLVDPGAPIPPTITILTGITEAMVLDAPDIATALPAFLEFLGDTVIVGHNVRFDMSFLNAAAVRLGYSRLDNRTVDTASLARRLVRPEVKNLRLRTLARHFRSPVTPTHRALDDALATSHVLHGLLERAGSLGVTNLDDLLQLPTARGSAHYSKISLTEDLPRAPGVYFFRDRDGTIIYVGKATNLRARVRQYFYGDQRRSVANLMRELDSVQYATCPTELEAAVTEIRLIHTHRPRYNRRSRPPKTSHFVKLTKERFPRLSIVRKVRDDGLAYLGPFRTKASADLVANAIWDAIPIRRCRTRPGSRNGACAPAQMGLALCPCDGSLDEASYRRVVEDLIHALDHQPQIVLEPLVDRMNEFASLTRYEEAAWARDRHDALARALQARHQWKALQQMGWCEFEMSDGARVLVDHGRLAATWRESDPPVLRPAGAVLETSAEVPSDFQTAEEARLVWAWLRKSEPKLVEADNSFAVPINMPQLLGRG